MQKTKKPLIAIFGSRAEERRMQGVRLEYMRAITEAGGIPVLAPMVASRELYREIAERFDGFLFAGGVDLDPVLFGEEKHERCGEIDPLRDECELCAMEEILKTKKAVLGICRGVQTMAVARGGKLWQDIPSQVSSNIEHARAEDQPLPMHKVVLKEGSLLHSIVGECEMLVNSFHHQAVKSTALSVTATAPDGIVEALEDQSHPFFLGVQWHPEQALGDGVSEKIFRAFCAKAKG